MEALLAEVESACMESLKESFRGTATRTLQPMEEEVARSLGRQEVVFLLLINSLAHLDPQMEALLAEVESACMELLKESFRGTATRTLQPMEEEVARSLGRQEVVFLLLINSLAHLDPQMSGLLLGLALTWNVLPSIVTAQFNVQRDVLERAVRFARLLDHSGLFTIPRELQTLLDQLLEELSTSGVQREESQAFSVPEETPAAAQPPPPQPRMSRRAAQRQLWEGVEKNDGRLVKEAVLSGADLGVVRADKGYRTPLALAASEGRVEAVRALLRLGAQLEGRGGGEGRTALHWASAGGREEIVRELLEAGASPEVEDSSKYTPLHLASQNGHEEIVKHLLAAGASVEAESSNKWTPLHMGSQNGHEAVVIELLEAGASVRAVTRYGSTPLHLAAERGHLSTVRLLVGDGADFNTKDCSGHTPLHLSSREGHEEVVRWLLEVGASVRAVTNYGSTPLHFAAKEGHLSIVRQLVENGAADINAMCICGETPLFYARNARHTAVEEYLCWGYVGATT